MPKRVFHMSMESSSRYRAGFTSGVSVYLTASRQTSNGALESFTRLRHNERNP